MIGVITASAMMNLAGVSAAGETNAAVSTNTTETAMFGAGCFWCSEAVLQKMPGVKSVTSGYAGGSVPRPTYKQVCSGKTGHAEVVQVVFDPLVVSYRQLLDVFWRMHDPTTANRQGADVGTQYRSVIFYYSPSQKAAAEASKRTVEASGRLGGPVVTEIVPAADFFPAEEHHQDYYNRNADAPYCRFVIVPKLKKLGMDHSPAR